MMKTATCLLLLLAFVHASDIDHQKHWNYGSLGPKTWGQHCGGKKQSPINIVTCETYKSSSSNRIFSHNYWKKSSGNYTARNNGHALQIDLGPTDYELKKGAETFIPAQVHIHFDPLTGKGSEHTLNSKQYFAEIHIVHANSKYKQLLSQPDGLLVIGTFVDLIEDAKYGGSNLDFTMNDSMSPVVMPSKGTSFAMQLFGFAARHLTQPKDTRHIRSFPLAWLLPKATRRNAKIDYVNYKGSLTTPPCSEVVDWIVITGKTLEVNAETAEVFKEVKNSDGEPMAGNHRPIMDLNGREVFGVKGVF